MRTVPTDIVTAAQNSFRQYKILPSVQIAQWALESAWGSKVTGKFNFFGIKATKNQNATICWTHEVIDGKLTPIQQRFANYSSVQDAFDAHAELLADPDGPYAKAIPLASDMERYVCSIAPIYATDTTYANNVINLIRVDEFQRYDVLP